MLVLGLDAKTIEQVAICLAKKAPEVNKILKGVKPYMPAAPAAEKAEKEKPAETAPVKAKRPPGKKPKTKRTQK